MLLDDLFERGIAVKVLDGIAAGERTERSLNLYPERSPKPKALKPNDAGFSAANCE